MKRFPVLGSSRYGSAPGAPTSVPWDLLTPHEAQAERNHYQSLRELAERGGLSPAEMVAVLEDRPWRNMDLTAAITRLRELVDAFEDRRQEAPTSTAHICAAK